MNFPCGGTVNLAPADLPKESGRFDLAMALGILAASDQIPANCFADYEFAGELSLTGELRPVHGALAMTWFAHKSRRAFMQRGDGKLPNGPSVWLAIELGRRLGLRRPNRYRSDVRAFGIRYKAKTLSESGRSVADRLICTKVAEIIFRVRCVCGMNQVSEPSKIVVTF